MRQVASIAFQQARQTLRRARPGQYFGSALRITKFLVDMPRSQNLRDPIALTFPIHTGVIEKTISYLGDFAAAQPRQHGNTRIVRGPPLDPIVGPRNSDVRFFRQIHKLVQRHTMTQEEAHHGAQEVATAANYMFLDVHDGSKDLIYVPFSHIFEKLQ